MLKRFFLLFTLPVSWLQICCMRVLRLNLRPGLTVQPPPGSRWSRGRGKKVMSVLHHDSSHLCLESAQVTCSHMALIKASLTGTPVIRVGDVILPQEGAPGRAPGHQGTVPSALNTSGITPYRPFCSLVSSWKHMYLDTSSSLPPQKRPKNIRSLLT